MDGKEGARGEGGQDGPGGKWRVTMGKARRDERRIPQRYLGATQEQGLKQEPVSHLLVTRPSH